MKLPPGAEIVSVVRIREGPYYRGFFKKKCMRILSVHRKLSVIERCLHGEVRLYFCKLIKAVLIHCKFIQHQHISIQCFLGGNIANDDKDSGTLI